MFRVYKQVHSEVPALLLGLLLVTRCSDAMDHNTTDMYWPPLPIHTSPPSPIPTTRRLHLGRPLSTGISPLESLHWNLFTGRSV